MDNNVINPDIIIGAKLQKKLLDHAEQGFAIGLDKDEVKALVEYQKSFLTKYMLVEALPEEWHEQLKDLIAWHQKAAIEITQDMSQDNYDQLVAARLAIINHCK